MFARAPCDLHPAKILLEKKSCPFLQTCHLGTLQRELRRCRFGHGSSGARHVVITDCTAKKKMHAVGMSSNGWTFIWRSANIGWLVHQRKWRAEFNTWYFDIGIFQLLLHDSWNCSHVLVTMHSIDITKKRLLYCHTDPWRCTHVSYSYHLCFTCPIYYLCTRKLLLVQNKTILFCVLKAQWDVSY